MDKEVRVSYSQRFARLIAIGLPYLRDAVEYERLSVMIRLPTKAWPGQLPLPGQYKPRSNIVLNFYSDNLNDNLCSERLCRPLLGYSRFVIVLDPEPCSFSLDCSFHQRNSYNLFSSQVEVFN